MTDRDHAPESEAATGPLVTLASRVPAPAVAAIAGIGIAVFVVVGILQRVAFPDWGLANLDSEVSLATRFSSGLLWAGALWWVMVALTVRPRSVALWAWSLIMAWLALDEGSAVHEQLERWSGIDWQILYLPVMGLAAVVWLALVRRYRLDRGVVVLLVAAAAAWGTALMLELVQNWGGEPVQAAIYNPTMIAEEALEMIGSAVLLRAAILALQIATRARPPSTT